MVVCCRGLCFCAKPVCRPTKVLEDFMSLRRGFRALRRGQICDHSEVSAAQKSEKKPSRPGKAGEKGLICGVWTRARKKNASAWV